MIRRRNSAADTRDAPSRRLSGIVGGILFAIGILWIGWLLLASHSNVSDIPLWPGISNPSAPINVQATPLLAEGISVSLAHQTPSISQEQALTLANQYEPDAATQAKNVSAKFVLLNYAPVAPAIHNDFNNTPVWMIWYQRIPLAPNDPSASTRSSHDLYVFLDGTTGKEVLKVWI